MKKIFLLFLFLQLCKPIVALAQFNASQIKLDGYTVKGNTSNQLMVDTSHVATKLYVQNQVAGGGAAWGGITGTLSNQSDLQTALNAKLSLSDTASMLTRYLRSNAATLLFYPLSSNPSSYLVAADISGKLNISDTATMLTNYLRKGTAASTYEPIISAGTTGQYWRGDKSWQTLNATAVGLGNVPNLDATNPSNTVQTSSFRFVTDAEKSTWNAKQAAITTGTTLQYFRGDLSLAAFPTAVSSFTNDAGYATATSSTAFSNKTGNISQWTNDAGYITSSGVTPAALTKTDDTNVTLTLGGTPSTALLQATSLTLGWTGTLADGRIASASTWNAKESALTFSTGLTRSTNTITVNTSQNISTLSNLTSNGFVKTSGGTGALSIDGNTYFNVANNLSEGTAATMRTNLGLGTAATQSTGTFLQTSNNLSDVTAATARTNLGLGTLATQSGTFSGTSSGTNTGDQTITLTGNVTGSGTGSFATTIANSAVTNAMLAGSIDLTSKVTGALPIANGGTNATTALTARANLGTSDAYKSGDQTTAAGTNTVITGITFTTSASETWSFECYLTGQVSGAGGAAFTVVYSNAPSTSTINTLAPTTGAGNQTTTTTINTTPAQTGTMWAAATTEFGCFIRGCFTNGASANTVTIKVQPVNGAQTVTIRSNSYITSRRIN